MSSSTDLKDFLQTPFKTFFLLWIPVLFSMIAEPLTGLVDTAFISRLGAESLAALGVGTVVLSSGLWLFNFLSIGSQTEVSQARGRQDLTTGKSIGSLAILLAVIIGLFLTVAALVFAPIITAAMGATDVVHDHAVTYIRIRAFGGPAVLLSMASFGILYGLADMRSPLLIALTVNAINIVLDGLLIFGLGPFPVMGIAGAALATSISQWVGAILCFYRVHKKMGFTSRVKIGDIRKLLKIGRDMVIRTGALIIFLLLATRSATQLGPEAGAAHQAIRQVWMFTSLFLDASAITAQSLIGYFFGSGHIGNAKKVARLVCQISIVIGVGLMVVMLAGSGMIAKALVPLSSLLLFHPAWVVGAIFQPMAALAFVTDGIHWGTGDFRFLRNVVVLATTFGALGLWALEITGWVDLSLIWWVTGGWITIRACFGIMRIWPGILNSPLNTTD